MICPTFGRSSTQPELINEMVFWYTQLDYPRDRLELIVLNHAPGVVMKCGVPGVRVLNWFGPMPYLARKMEMLVSMAQGEICLPSEDDDISLPWRVCQAVRHLEGYDYWSPGGYWYSPGPDQDMVPDNRGVAHTCGGYRKTTWKGYSFDVTRGHDGVAKTWALENLNCNPSRLTNIPDLSFVYRWSVSQCHLSGNGERADEVYRAMKAGPPGVYWIEPRMGRDWVSHRDDMLRRHATFV